MNVSRSLHFRSCGTIEYSEDPYKVVVQVDAEIGRYYLTQLGKTEKVNKPRYPAHISVVRKELPRLNYWRKYHGERIEFEYDHVVYNDDIYFWLNAYSSSLEQLREELGLASTSEITRSPDGRHKFHITIGNKKGLL